MARKQGSKNKATLVDISERLARVEERLVFITENINENKEMAPRLRSLEVSRSYLKGGITVVIAAISFIAHAVRDLF